MRQFQRTVRSYTVTGETYYRRVGGGGHWELTHIEHRWNNPEGTGDYEAVYFFSPTDRDSYQSPLAIGSISFDMNWQKVETESKEQN